VAEPAASRIIDARRTGTVFDVMATSLALVEGLVYKYWTRGRLSGW
jgi:hypothetical protein